MSPDETGGAVAPPTFSDLLAKIEAATGPDREIDRIFATFFDRPNVQDPLPYTASIDAAFPCLERLFLDRSIAMSRNVWSGETRHRVVVACINCYEAPTLPLALLKAFVATFVDLLNQAQEARPS